MIDRLIGGFERCRLFLGKMLQRNHWSNQSARDGRSISWTYQGHGQNKVRSKKKEEKQRDKTKETHEKQVDFELD